MAEPKGFTIIELIVVIAIIAVLSAIVSVNVMSYITKAKDAGVLENIRNIVMAIELYEDQKGYSPMCGEIGKVNCYYYEEDTSDGITWNDVADKLVAAGVIGDSNGLRKDPWGKSYNYLENYKKGSGYNRCSTLMSDGVNGEIDNGDLDACPSNFTPDDKGMVFNIVP